MRDIDAIRKRHLHGVGTIDSRGKVEVCTYCWVDWPCHTRVVLDALTNQVDRSRIHAKRYLAQQDEARADR